MSQARTYPLWISHTSMQDFLSCPRAYYLRHIYKHPKTGRKINLINPAMALGLTVHDVLEPLAKIPAEDRMSDSLLDTFEKAWEHVSGEMGGFRDAQEEAVYKKRGLQMIQRVISHPGPILNKAVRLHSPDELPPRYMLSPGDNIMLCGKIDWLEYFPEDDSVHIIDFKTGTREEKENSLQLPIYMLLVKHCQKRTIKKISYWYLERDNEPMEKELPDYAEAVARILEVGLQIKQLRLAGKYACMRNGCYSCRPLEMIVNGKAKWIKTSGYMDVYTLLHDLD